MSQVIHFAPRPNPTQLTVVYDDIALFCTEATKRLRKIAQPQTRLDALELSAAIQFIAAGPAANKDRTHDYMIPLGQEIISRSDAMLNLLAVHFEPGEIADMARSIFTLPPINTPGAPDMGLDQKRAVLHAFGGSRIAALLK